MTPGRCVECKGTGIVTVPEGHGRGLLRIACSQCGGTGVESASREGNEDG